MNKLLAILRGKAKVLFPGVTAIIETAKNIKQIKENVKSAVPVKLPHDWSSISGQVMASAFIWWLVATGKIDVAKALEFFWPK